MRWVAGYALWALVSAVPAHAQSPAESAAALTTRGRSIEAILESVIFPERDTERAVILVIDPSRSLRNAQFATKFAKVLRANKSQNLRLGVAIIGAKKGDKALPPGSDFNDVRKRVFDAFGNARNVLRDVYSPLRDVAPLFARERGQRTIILVAHQNGDAEYKLEKVIAALKKSKIRVVVITREVLLSDAYWYRKALFQTEKPPANAYRGGSDGAFVDVPWGWLHQDSQLTSVAGSGFAAWGLSRLASATGGRVEIIYTRPPSRHICGGRLFCRFCDFGDHDPPTQRLLAVRLKAVEPSLEARRLVCKRAASDPYYKAVLRAWSAAYKAGLIVERPAMRRGGGTLVQDWDRTRNYPSSYMSRLSDFKRAAYDAKLQAGAANKLAARLRKAIAAGDRTGRGSDRYRAIAELTYVMLRLTRLNLLYLREFHREVAPRFVKPEPFEPPEIATRPIHKDVASYYMSWTTMPLCHGVEPFLHLRLPGGNGLDVELRAFAIDYQTFLKRNAHTPFTVALSHMGIARYTVLTLGKGNVKGSTGPARQNPSSGKKQNTATAKERERGERDGGKSGGGSGTPTSGG